MFCYIVEKGNDSKGKIFLSLTFLLNSAIGGLRIGDMFFQLMILLFIVSVILFIIRLVKRRTINNKRLEHLEEKVDELLEERNKNKGE